MERGMAYVMLGRCENLKDIFIAGEFKKEGINVDNEALEESKALEKAFQDDQQLFPLSSFLKVSFLNVRSLRAHIEDVKLDNSIVGSDFFGLAETWLYPNESLSIEGFQSCFVNVGKGKGIASFSKIGLETVVSSSIGDNYSAICVRSQYLDIIFVYLSQDFNKDQLFTLLDDWIVTTKETALLGDVNWNYLEEEHDMKKFMIKKGFSQLIESPTHEKGSLIDHVYVNEKLSENGCLALQESVHFSDHNLITLLVNKE